MDEAMSMGMHTIKDSDQESSWQLDGSDAKMNLRTLESARVNIVK